MEADTTSAVHRLIDTLNSEALGFEEPIGCHIFEANEAGERNLTVWVGLPDGLPKAPYLRVETLPGGDAAATRHVGPYSQLGLAHFALFAWVNERQYQANGPILEMYINDPTEVAPSELVTELQLFFRS